MMSFTKEQREQIIAKGISEEVVDLQMENFRTGFPYLSVKDAATPANGGIKVLSDNEIKEATDAKNGYAGSVVKFVPASGAASRMFKDLFTGLEDLERGERVTSSRAQEFLDNVRRFPFMNDRQLLEMILKPAGLNYGSTPKGLVAFHKYKTASGEMVRTAFEEHLVEGALYARDADGVVKMSFTVSPEHLERFKNLLESVKGEYEKEYDCRYDIHFTIQSPSTDTVAADMDNKPFVTSDGKLLFRPGGHGALIENLNEVDADAVVVKNIDNVVHEDLVEDTVKWKNILLGRGIILEKAVHHLLKRLYSEQYTAQLENEALQLLKNEFSIIEPNSLPDKKSWIISKLNRPIRVCGMVKNEGEPGGGPYIVNEEDGSTSLQILEAAQIDKSDASSVDKMNHSTHFNPVDLVCFVKDYKGCKFNLKQFVDHRTGFISEKSYEGRPLKAQELPGLWNGSMSRWNTQFVEVPLSTFNPVKTVMDLLRPQHDRCSENDRQI